ncbi:AlbA family DNA-binding domain-containing protein [Tessaracoccus caeni]|uniref:AlbA family DNA-binding domain-containing protein n=1 Tax=Tessaracoccus caeni TaxID=3031239 RepID=UPI0023DB9DB2|nr:ATP-binding protein [Tessaracoccus caeni]MDF1487318.1 ATP-binding protein [Tessaracoccus caeni]
MNPPALPDAPLQTVAVFLLISLLVAWGLSLVAHRILRGRARLRGSTSIVISLMGMAVGLLLLSWTGTTSPLWSALTLLTSLGMSLLGIALYGALVTHFQRPQRGSVPELLKAGESDRVEFKSTARVNLHTGKKDDRMEQVIAKTVCAFLNTDGGTLLIGVDDDGTPLGLEPDFATMKAPDADRYELWLRDLLSNTLGQHVAALVQVEFTTLPSSDGTPADVCRVTAPPGPTPTYFRPNKSATPELWARLGNSSRQLTVDAATEYVMHRWPLSPAANFRAQFRAVFRNSVPE